MSLNTTQTMQALAGGLDQILNANKSEKFKEHEIIFALIVWQPDGPDPRANWVSKGSRKDMLVALKEIVARFEGQAEQQGTA